MTKAPRAVEGLLFALCLLTYVYCFDGEVGTNAQAHFDQTIAIVEHGRLSINPLVASVEGYTLDWSLREETRPDGTVVRWFYPAKAPGLSLLGVPVYAAASAVERAAGVDPLGRRAMRWNGWILSWALASLPAALATIAMLRLALGLGVRLDAAVLGTLAIALGSTYAPFATALYAHAPTAAAIAGAGALVLAGEVTARRAAAAGLLVGIATLVTYQAAIAVAALGAAAIARAAPGARLRTALAFAAGGLPPLAGFAAVHQVQFGSPFRTAYDFQNPIFGGGGGTSWASIARPLTLARGRDLLFGQYRGLFYYAPVTGAAIAAAGAALVAGAGGGASRDRRIAAAAALAILAAFLVVTGMHPLWFGGCSTGPRLLVPALALLAPFAAIAYERWPRATAALASISTVNALATAAVSLTAPENVVNPLVQEVYPVLAAGQVGRANLATLLGFPGTPALLPWMVGAAGLALGLHLAISRIRSGS